VTSIRKSVGDWLYFGAAVCNSGSVVAGESGEPIGEPLDFSADDWAMRAGFADGRGFLSDLMSCDRRLIALSDESAEYSP
jgi:hypothetical protein